MRIKYLYKRVIRDIMKDHGISPSPQGYEISKEATFDEVVQYTDHYVGKGNDEQPKARPDYRYRRYKELLRGLTPSGQREAQIDLGCGAGLFSWVFLDWAVTKRLDPGLVELYGLDQCPAMLCLAQEIRSRLMRHIPNYPKLRYDHDPKSLLETLTKNHRKGTDYIITFGHVLAQAHTPEDVDAFTRVIVHILELMGARSNCMVLAVDARNAATPYAAGWSSLLKSLEDANIRHEQHEVRKTRINDNESASMASLHLAK